MDSDTGDSDPVKGRTDPMKKLMWSGLLAGVTAVVSVVANRTASAVWRRMFDEEPPE
ncbi:MAG TPA: hypothetical protein VHM72_04930 [Solirubrobacteraceae bacterium]|jgi:hypothetical protein|nr:hypothetical protein [Solirubrobacteraceae bacterium]